MYSESNVILSFQKGHVLVNSHMTGMFLIWSFTDFVYSFDLSIS
jgi:hypothetical protein